MTPRPRELEATPLFQHVRTRAGQGRPAAGARAHDKQHGSLNIRIRPHQVLLATWIGFFAIHAAHNPLERSYRAAAAALVWPVMCDMSNVMASSTCPSKTDA